MTFDSDGRYYCRVDYSPDTAPLMPALRVYVYRMFSFYVLWKENRNIYVDGTAE